MSAVTMARYRAAGRCPRCGGERGAHVHCDDCLWVIRIKRAEQWNPFCVCGRHRISLRNEEDRCFQCKRERGDYERARQARQDASRCTRCQTVLQGDDRRFANCRVCRRRYRLRARERRRQDRLAKPFIPSASLSWFQRRRRSHA